MRNVLLKTAGAFALLGFLLTTRRYILFLNTLSPFQGLLVYYLQIFLTLEFLQYIGLVIGGVRQETLMHTLGELMVIFAFFIVVDFESEWVQVVVGDESKEKQNCPRVYLQAEDGAVYYLWKKVTQNPETLRLLTFVVTPVLLSVIGVYLMGGRAIKRELLG